MSLLLTSVTGISTAVAARHVTSLTWGGGGVGDIGIEAGDLFGVNVDMTFCPLTGGAALCRPVSPDLLFRVIPAREVW